MGFDTCNFSMKIRESIGNPTPQSGSSLGVFAHYGDLIYMDVTMVVFYVFFNYEKIYKIKFIETT